MSERSAPTAEWISVEQARELTGLTPGKLAEAAIAGRVRMYRERGAKPRYNRADLLAYAGILAR